MISSLDNPQLKRIRRLQNDRRFRYRTDSFVTEGTRWLQEWVEQSGPVQRVFYTAAWATLPLHAALLERIEAPALPVSDEVMAAMSDTETPPGVLVEAEMLHLAPPQPGTLYLLLDGVANPGNLGTMLRTAVAAGVDAVLLAPDCVDPYNPKVVRGSMGAHLRVPILALDWAEIEGIVSHTAVWLAEAGAATRYTDVDWAAPATLVIGSEARGPSAAARALMRGPVTIPMAAATESLNAAVAAAVILFEAARQRGFARGAFTS